MSRGIIQCYRKDSVTTAATTVYTIQLYPASTACIKLEVMHADKMALAFHKMAAWQIFSIALHIVPCKRLVIVINGINGAV